MAMQPYGNPESLRLAPEQVLYEKDARRHVAWITLNRPEKHNAMSVPMRARLAALIHESERDDEVHVIVIRGNGKSFCSGNEINEDWGQRVPGQKRMTLTTANRYATDMNYGRHGFSQAISRCSKVTILQLHGYCAAAAYFMIATRTDLVMVSEDAKIGALEARFLGPAGAVSAVHINRIVGTKAARRMGYTALPVTGADAAGLGLAYRCLPNGGLQAATDALAAQIAARPRELVRYYKARIRAAESLFDTSVREINGLLFSHFLQAEKDEAHFWTSVKKSGVGGALDADKARLAAAAGAEKPS
jgi:enoyl-CoA hydratase/carnithine racemase